MINRQIYRAQIKDDKINEVTKYFEIQKENIKNLVDNGRLITLSAFKCENDLFLYYECKNTRLTPIEIFKQSKEYLQIWPGAVEARYWVPMYDIFHYDKPITDEYWERKEPVQKAVGRIACLKPEMLSSYIFYHFQYQEEKPCDGYKSGIIGIHENLIFFYTEEPEVKEAPTYEGLLKTSNTPPVWMDVMTPHFIFWNNVPLDQEIWKETDLLLWV